MVSRRRPTKRAVFYEHGIYKKNPAVLLGSRRAQCARLFRWGLDWCLELEDGVVFAIFSNHKTIWKVNFIPCGDKEFSLLWFGANFCNNCVVGAVLCAPQDLVGLTHHKAVGGLRCAHRFTAARRNSAEKVYTCDHTNNREHQVKYHTNQAHLLSCHIIYCDACHIIYCDGKKNLRTKQKHKRKKHFDFKHNILLPKSQKSVT